MAKNSKKFLLTLMVLLPNVANCMDISDEEEYIIHGSKLTNSPIPTNPQPVGKVSRDNLKSDDTRDMFYYNEGFSSYKDHHDDEAFKNFQKAANMGHLHSMYQLRYLYYHGIGVNKDVNLSNQWLNKMKHHKDYESHRAYYERLENLYGFPSERTPY